ncbi:putative transcriptional regulatory protein C3C7.04 like [Verticillium longisporum]|uniref:Putative transcriptional regulatory protein C3C7.04 like n=1 Tax=Verticillium longisporum TaxID=100787 RepID=A0A8I2ZM53_VERLO|nr:putative transcriptional regulatory protein C3C7.04 like [Verticillium longisporum]
MNSISVTPDRASGALNTPDSDPTPASPGRRPKIKSTACNRCHARKVKCSGGRPCENCRQASKAVDCTYPRRNRQVKVSQRYIDDLIEENKRLKGLLDDTTNPNASSLSALSVSTAPSPRRDLDVLDSPDVARHNTSNIMLEVRPWFVPSTDQQTPILIGEVPDASFSTRFRQAISAPHEQPYKHIPRTAFATDERIACLTESECAWPSPSRARFLVEVALRYVSRCYHIVRRSVVMDALEHSIHNPAWGESLIRCKLWGLFAIGELYSARSIAPGKDFPGLPYFAKASRMLSVLSERPTIDAIEIIHLLSFYSLALNRRYTSYILAGMAVRMAVLIGLHLNIPAAQLPDAAVREHRNRLWATTCIFDRMWASKLGQPAAIGDRDIMVDPPSNASVDAAVAGDFGDCAYYIASSRLASITSTMVRCIYNTRDQSTTLSSRVQQTLKDLREWVQELPSHLHLDAAPHSEAAYKPTPLHLSFNQSAILATRPILLHVLKTHAAAWPAPAGAMPVPASAMTIVAACVRCARHSLHLLTECWIDGSFATFDYFYTSYLFSALTVLAASSLLDGPDATADREQFDSASGLLAQLADGGNFAAKEDMKHVDAMKAAVTAAASKKRGVVGLEATTGLDDFASVMSPAAWASSTTAVQGMATAGMALTEPSLQELLAEPFLDMQFIDASVYDDYSQGLYWPDFSTENWTPETWVPGS